MIIAEDAIPEIVLELDFVKIGLVLWIKESVIATNVMKNVRKECLQIFNHMVLQCISKDTGSQIF